MARSRSARVTAVSSQIEKPRNTRTTRNKNRSSGHSQIVTNDELPTFRRGGYSFFGSSFFVYFVYFVVSLLLGVVVPEDFPPRLGDLAGVPARQRFADQIGH